MSHRCAIRQFVSLLQQDAGMDALRVYLRKDATCVGRRLSDGNTLLHLACRHGKGETVRVVLENAMMGKGILRSKNNDGQTGFAVALEHNPRPDLLALYLIEIGGLEPLREDTAGFEVHAVSIAMC